MGVDPGFSVTGYGVVKKEGNRAYLLDAGIAKMASTKTLSERVGLFYDVMQSKINQHAVQALALETSFLHKNAQNFLKLGYLRGILYLLADQHQLVLQEFAPSEIKKSITGFGGADKEQVARVLLRLFPGLWSPEKLDMTDALAVALCGLWTLESAKITSFSLAHK